MQKRDIARRASLTCFWSYRMMNGGRKRERKKMNEEKMRNIFGQQNAFWQKDINRQQMLSVPAGENEEWR